MDLKNIYIILLYILFNIIDHHIFVTSIPVDSNNRVQIEGNMNIIDSRSNTDMSMSFSNEDMNRDNDKNIQKNNIISEEKIVGDYMQNDIDENSLNDNDNYEGIHTDIDVIGSPTIPEEDLLHLEDVNAALIEASGEEANPVINAPAVNDIDDGLYQDKHTSEDTITEKDNVDMAEKYDTPGGNDSAAVDVDIVSSDTDINEIPIADSEIIEEIHGVSLEKDDREEITELIEQEPIFIPDDDELVDDNLFRDIIHDEKNDQMKQNGADSTINANGDTINIIQSNNGDSQGTAATIASPKTGDYDSRPTEEEMITHSLFLLYSYILAISLFILSFLIWIMWFRYNDVISAVHGSKGVLFFETPPNVRVTDNWTGLPGAHCRPNKEHFQKKKRNIIDLNNNKTNNNNNKHDRHNGINNDIENIITADQNNNKISTNTDNMKGKPDGIVRAIPMVVPIDDIDPIKKKKKKKKKKKNNKKNQQYNNHKLDEKEEMIESPSI